MSDKVFTSESFFEAGACVGYRVISTCQGVRQVERTYLSADHLSFDVANRMAKLEAIRLGGAR